MRSRFFVSRDLFFCSRFAAWADYFCFEATVLALDTVFSPFLCLQPDVVAHWSSSCLLLNYVFRIYPYTQCECSP